MAENGAERNLSRYLADYEQLPFEATQEYFRRKNLISFLGDRKVDSALEVGCGRSSFFSDWQKASHFTIVEPIETLLKGAEASLGNSIQLLGICSTLEEAHKHADLPKHDVTIMSSLLHEVDSPLDLLHAAANHTAPGGLIYLTVTNARSIHRLLGVENKTLDSLASASETEVLMQQRSGAFTIEALESLLQSAGMSVNRSRTIFPKLLPHAMMQNALDLEIIDRRFLEQIDTLGALLVEFGSEIMVEAKLAD